jgi:tellurite resistance protein TehA-like permease
LLCRATATWWIPLLLSLSAWRLLIEKAPPRYNPSVWAAVFPLGMYSQATRQMASALNLSALGVLAIAMFVVAMIAWALAFVGLARDLGKALIGASD